MSDVWRDRLSEFRDGELEAAEQQALERHLEGCAACRRDLEALRRVARRLDAAPDREPEQDLWPELERRLAAAGHTSRPVWSTVGWGGARWVSRLAAVLVVALVLGSAGLLLRGRGNGSLERSGEGAAGSAARASDGYQQAVAAWRGLLGERALPAALDAAVQAELAAFDRAIEETRSALLEDPSDADLMAHLTRTLQSQMRFVSRVEGWAREES